MSTTRNAPLSSSKATGWVGWIAFAGVMMIMIGTFNVIDGLAALFKDEVFVNTGSGLLVFDLTAWGWIHLLFGLAQAGVGLALLYGQTWARVVSIGLVAFNAVAQLAFLSAYPIWAALIIVLDVFVLWALIVHGDEMRAVR